MAQVVAAHGYRGKYPVLISGLPLTAPTSVDGWPIGGDTPRDWTPRHAERAREMHACWHGTSENRAALATGDQSLPDLVHTNARSNGAITDANIGDAVVSMDREAASQQHTVHLFSTSGSSAGRARSTLYQNLLVCGQA